MFDGFRYISKPTKACGPALEPGPVSTTAYPSKPSGTGVNSLSAPENPENADSANPLEPANRPLLSYSETIPPMASGPVLTRLSRSGVGGCRIHQRQSQVSSVRGLHRRRVKPARDCLVLRG